MKFQNVKSVVQKRQIGVVNVKEAGIVEGNVKWKTGLTTKRYALYSLSHRDLDQIPASLDSLYFKVVNCIFIKIYIF